MRNASGLVAVVHQVASAAQGSKVQFLKAGGDVGRLPAGDNTPGFLPAERQAELLRQLRSDSPGRLGDGDCPPTRAISVMPASGRSIWCSPSWTYTRSTAASAAGSRSASATIDSSEILERLARSRDAHAMRDRRAG